MGASFRVGACLVEPDLNQIQTGAGAVRVEPKIMQVLVCLAERRGEVLSKDHLLNAVWTDTFVGDEVLKRCISELRRVFGDDARNPRIIQTVPKGGYRLLVNGSDRAQPLANPNRNATGEAAQSPLGRRWRALLVLATVAVVLFLLGAYTATGRLRHRVDAARSGRVMLAVLPFRNLSTDPDQEYFADGLTAEMISQLGRLSIDRVGVISWASTENYKGTRLSEDKIASELGAAYLLEGTVRRAGKRVRITAELIKADDLSHVWADSYDGELGDVITAQNHVADAIAREVQGHFVASASTPAPGSKPIDPEGYVAYLKGLGPKDGDRRIMQEKIESFEQAIRLNRGNYAPAYAGVAMSYINMSGHGLAPSKEAYEKALVASEKALELDPLLPAAHDARGWVYWRYAWNFRSAGDEFRRALELQPNGVHIRESYSLYLKSMGRYSEALEQVELALQMSPRAAYTLANAGSLLALAGRYGEANQNFQRAVESDPNSYYPHERYGTALLWQGKVAEAIDQFKQARQASGNLPETSAWLAYAYALNHQQDEAEVLLGELDRAATHAYVSPYHVALVYAGLGEKAKVLEWLNRAVEQRDEWLVYLHVAPEFNAYRSDPRFRQVEARIGFSAQT